MVFTKKQMGTSSTPKGGTPTPAQSGGKGTPSKGGTPTPAQSGVPNRGSALTNPGKKKKTKARVAQAAQTGDYGNLFMHQNDMLAMNVPRGASATKKGM